jgi:hypothetical protein
MTTDDLIALAREFLGDKVEPYLWSDDFLLGALNRAEQEAAIRLLCFNDETTDAVTKINVLANTATYTLDSRVIRIDALLYDGKPLPQVDPDDLSDSEGNEWRDQTGTPAYWFSDGRKITLVPEPVTTATVRLKAKRLPVADMTSFGSPELDSVFHRTLLHWVCWEAHQIIDSDVARPDWAALQRAQFDSVFGPQVPARVQIHQRRSPRNLTHAPAPYVSRRTTSDGDW